MTIETKHKQTPNGKIVLKSNLTEALNDKIMTEAEDILDKTKQEDPDFLIKVVYSKTDKKPIFALMNIKTRENMIDALRCVLSATYEIDPALMQAIIANFFMHELPNKDTQTNPENEAVLH